jgi:hypothetical protein
MNSIVHPGNARIINKYSQYLHHLYADYALCIAAFDISEVTWGSEDNSETVFNRYHSIAHSSDVFGKPTLIVDLIVIVDHFLLYQCPN